MAKYSTTVQYNIQTRLDASGLTQLQSQLRQCEVELTKLRSHDMISTNQVIDAQKKIATIRSALASAYNGLTGTLNVNKFTQSLAAAGITAKQMGATLNAMGASGQNAFTGIMGAMGKLDTRLKSTTKAADKIWNTLGNTVRWGIIASGFQEVMNAAHNAIQYMQDLDRSLTDIMLVSDYTKEDMREFAQYANEAAAALGNTTVAYTDAAMIYAQQGYNLEDQKKLADMTLKVANVTGQETSEVSEQMTSIINGYGLAVDDLGASMDQIAKIANISAADVEELAVASSRVAATASALGVDQAQLYSQIGTIVSVTREAPEVVGNALKTIYARFGDLKMGETLEDGVDLGSFSGALEKLGVQVLDTNGQMRDMGSIIEDLMQKWNTFDRATQQSAAVTLAGKFQYNRLMTLMNNQDMYYDYLEQAENESLGTLDEMESEYLDSLAGKRATFQATIEGLLTNLFNQDDFGVAIDFLTNLINLVNTLVSSIGGGIPLLTAFAGIMTRTFSQNIARNIAQIDISNMAKTQSAQSTEAAKQFIMSQNAGLMSGEQERLQNFLAWGLTNNKAFDTTQLQQYNQIVDSLTGSVKGLATAEEQLQVSTQATNAILQKNNMELLTKNNSITPFRVASANGLDWGAEAEQVSVAYDRLEKRLTNIQSKLAAVGVAEGDTTVKTRELFNAVSTLPAAFTNASNGCKNVDQVLKQNVVQTMNQLKEQVRSGVLDIERFSTEIEKLITNTRLVGATLKSGNFFTDSQTAETAFLNAGLQRDILNAAVADAEGYQTGIDKQQTVKQILDVSGAVMQLGFAWQSFQHLGSLLADDSLSGAEKLMQLLTNIGFTLPMIITGFQQLNKLKLTSITANFFGGIADKYGLLANGMSRVQAGAEGVAQANRAAAAGMRIASNAAGGLSKAFSVLGGPIGVAMIALTALTTALSYYQEQQQQIYDDQKEQATNGLENYNDISSQIDSFQELYKQYQDTGQVSDEFKQSAEAVTEALDDQNAKVALAIGDYEALGEAISNADAKQRKMAERDLETFLNSTNKESLEGGFLNGSIYADLRTAIGKLNPEEYIGETAVPTKETQELWDQITQAEQNNSPAEAIGIINKTLKDYNTAIDDLDNQIKQAEDNGDDQETIDALEAQRDNYYHKISILQEALNIEDIADFQEQQGQLASLNAMDIASEITAANGDYQKVVDAFFNNENIRAYLEALGPWSDQLEWMINNTSDEAGKLALMLEQKKEEQANLLNRDRFAQEEFNNLRVQTQEGGDWMTLDEAGISPDEFMDSLQQAFDDLPPDQQLNVRAKLDEGASLEQILQALTGVVDEASQSAKEIIAGTSFENLKLDSDVDEEGFRALSDYLGDAGSEVEGYSDRLKENEEALKDTAEAQKRYDSALEDSFDNLEDWKDALNSDDIEDHAEAISELQNVYQDLLDLDPNTELSRSFLEDADNLNLLEQAIQGSEEAYAELQRRAAEDIWIQAGLDPASFDNVWNQMQALLDANSFNEIPIGATLDDMPFLQGLADMLAQAGLTASEIQGVLSSMGVDAEVVPEQTEQVDTMTYSGVQPEPIETAWNATLPLPDGSGTTHMSGTFPGVRYTPIPITESQEKAFTGFGMKVTTANGQSSGGGVTVKNATKVSNGGGGNKYRNSSVPRKQSSSGSGGGGGGKKGGGGGSGSTYEPKKKDPVEKTIDRYERINTLLDDTVKDFERIGDEQDRLIGFEQADNMNEQIDLLHKQIALHKEKLNIQKQEAVELRDQLASQYGITFDEEGFINNYAATHQRMIDELNSLIDQYNNTATEEGQEALDQQIEEAEKRLDKFEEKYQRYDELLGSDINDTIKQLEDLEDQIEDIRIEALKTQTEAVENFKDLQEAWIEFEGVFSGYGKDDPQRDMIESTSKLANYFDAGTVSATKFYDTLIDRTKKLMNEENTSAEKRKWYQQQLDLMEKARNAAPGSVEAYGTGYFDMEMLNMQMMLEQLDQYNSTGTSSIFGENSADLYEIARDVFNSAVDMVKDFEDEMDNLHDAILDMIDEIGDSIEDRREQFENITDELEHQREIAELLRGDRNYDEINEVLQAQQHNYQVSISSMQDQLDLLKDMQAGLQEGSEEWKKVQEMIVDTQQELNDLIEESLENMQEQYENVVSKIGDNWVDSALGTDLDWMEEQWELINRNADYYLDDTNAAYETQKLQSKYLDLLDNAGDLHTQQLITEQMAQQLGYLREKEKISEYDVQYAEMQIELLQKRIALEEAERNKQQLKLRRDSQGNYNYVYTADQDNIRDAQDDLLDAQNNAYNLSKEQMRQTQEDSLSALQDARKLIDDIWTDANLSLDEKKERTQTIIDSLKEYLAGTSEQLSTSEKNIINDFIGMVEMMTDENAERLQETYDQIVQGNLDAFDEIDTRWSDSLTQWLFNLEEFNDNTDMMFENLVANAEDYQQQIEILSDLARQNFNDITDAVLEARDATDSLAQSNAAFIDQLRSDAGVVLEYNNVLASYTAKIQDAENAMRAYQQEVERMKDQIAQKDLEIANLSSQVNETNNPYDFSSSGSGNGSGSGSGSSGDKSLKVGNKFGYTGWYYYDSWGKSPAGHMFAGQANAITIDRYSSTEYGGTANTTGNFKVHISAPDKGYNDLGWVKPDQLFDTGGYTGDWTENNPLTKNGRLAWLHSKELVLNEEDTQNILAAVTAVRDMATSMKTGTLSKLASALLDGSTVFPMSKETIEQTVSITAEFPNASSADEIKQALLSLSDQSFQYANRTR